MFRWLINIPVLVKSSFSRVILCSHLVRMRAVFTHEFTLGNLSVSEEPIWRTRRTADDVRAWKAKFYARSGFWCLFVSEKPDSTHGSLPSLINCFRHGFSGALKTINTNYSLQSLNGNRTEYRKIAIAGLSVSLYFCRVKLKR